MISKELPPHILNPDPAIYLSDNYSTLDVETTNEDKGSACNPKNRLLLSSYTDKEGHIVSYWGDAHRVHARIEELARRDFLIAHNAKFELQWIKRAGVDISQIVVWDTLLAEYVLAGNRKVRLGLDSVAKRYGVGEKGNVVSALIKGGVCPSEIPRSWLQEYCEQDVRITELVFKAQLPRIIAAGLLPVMFTRCLFTIPLADIEFNGVYLDKERVEETYHEYRQQLEEENKRLEQFSAGLNWNSPDQKANYIYGELGFTELRDRRGDPIRSPGGKPSTSAETIGKLHARNNKQAKFLSTYKKRSKLNAAVSKNLEFFRGICEEYGSTFRANFNQSVTRTHRLSSSGRRIWIEADQKYRSVQFQNMPRQFKNLVAARNPGWLVAETDGSQLEFRGAAFLGQDKKAIEDIRNDEDVHRYTAHILNECTEKEVTDDQRTLAKSDTFKPLFGGKSGTSLQVKYYAAFREKYHEIADTQLGWVDTVIRDKKLTVASGLIFYWPGCKVQRSGYVTDNESIHNYPVQSLSTAEIIPVAVTYQWHRMRAAQMESFLTNTVHDSSVGEIKPEERELFKEISVQAYTHDVYRYLHEIYQIDFNVPLGVEVKIGSHWGTGDEYTVDVEPPKYK